MDNGDYSELHMKEIIQMIYIPKKLELKDVASDSKLIAMYMENEFLKKRLLGERYKVRVDFVADEILSEHCKYCPMYLKWNPFCCLQFLLLKAKLDGII